MGRDDRAGWGAARPRHSSSSGHALEFLKDQYRHCKPILLMGAAQTLLGRGRHSRGAAFGQAPIRDCCNSVATSRRRAAGFHRAR